MRQGRRVDAALGYRGPGPRRRRAVSRRTAPAGRRSARPPGRGRGAARGPPAPTSSRDAQSRRWFALTRCQSPASRSVAQQRRALELVADELRPLGEHDEEPHEALVRRHPGVAPEHGVAEHRRPLDLPQEGRPAADVPDDVDVLEVLAPDPAEVRRAGELAVVEPVPEREPPSLARAAGGAPIQHAKPEPVPEVHERRRSARRAPGCAGSGRRRDQPVRRAGEAPVAVEAGADERLVGQVGAGEQARDPVEERGLRSGPAVDSRLYTAHSTRSASGAAAASRSARSPATSGPRRPATSRRPRPPVERVADEGSSRSTWSPAGSRPARGRGRRRARPRRPGGAGGRTRRRRWPARSRPTRISPSEPVEVDRLAAQLEHVDRGVHHGPRRVLRRERRVDDPLGRREQPLGAARRPGRRRRRAAATAPTFARVRGPPGHGARARRHQLHHAAASRGRPRAAARRPAGSPPTPRPARRRRATPGRRPRAGTRPARPGRATGSTPRRAGSIAAACQPHDGRTAGPNSGSSGSVAAASRPEHPRRPVVRPGEPLRDRTQRRRAQRPGGSAAARRRSTRCATSSSSAPSAAGVPCLSIGGRRALGEAPQVVAEPRRHRSPGAALQALDEAADERGPRPRTRATGCAPATGRRPGP